MRGPGPSTHAAGFSLVELLVTLAVLITLAVVATPSILGARDADRVRTAERWLEDFALAIHNPDSTAGSFHADINAYPGALEHLTRQIETTDLDGCGLEYKPGEVIPDKWRGSYVNTIIGSAGMPIGIGTLRNVLTRDDGRTVRNSIMRMYVDDVIIEDAMALDERVDLSDGSASGTVQWDTPPDAEGFVTVEYLMNVAGC